MVSEEASPCEPDVPIHVHAGPISCKNLINVTRMTHPFIHMFIHPLAEHNNKKLILMQGGE